MLEQSSRRFVGAIVILLLAITPLTVLPHQAHAASQTGVMIALYTYPGSTWDVVAQAKIAHPSVPIIAIINPNNGPGSSRDANYVSGIQELHAAGVVVLGYDATGYASNSASSVKSVMNTWKSLYTIDGIFFDEMANWSGPESYYSDLTSYAKSLGYTMTVGNPGTDTLPSYVGTVDNLMIYENPGLPPLSALQGWHTSYDKSNFSMIAFGVNSVSQSFLTSASNYVGYIDLTDDVLDNPYDSVPSYFGTLVADLDTGGSSATVPNAPAGLTSTAVSSSQINLSWIAPSNNGGSTITGYKIDRSTNGGSTWSTIVSNTGNTATTYSNTGLTANTSYSYRTSAINAIGTSSVSNTATATTSAAATGGTVSIIVKSANLAGTSFNGMWVELHASNGTTLATGYTPITFKVASGNAYTIVSSNYQNYVFNHWNGGTTTISKTITPTQNTSLTEYYSTGPVSLKIKTVNLSGTVVTG
ncbi:MAG TPA: spherulation-specific family 4 protein, partial [Candidatus Nitrosotalea sp.]|nr:spherulation-specific family 4 protein [Candidatus Nitrosotalea sp.]